MLHPREWVCGHIGTYSAAWEDLVYTVQRLTLRSPELR